MSKLREILEGWKNVVFENPVVEEVAIKRAETCSECPHNKHNTCELCGCPLIAKTRSPKSKCPDNRW